METLDFLFKACQTYGLFTVTVCILFIVILIATIKGKQFLNILKTIHDLIHHKINIRKNTLHSLAINQALDSMIAKYYLDRAWIFEYHNGGSNLAGIPFTKMSCTHERLSVGTKSFCTTCQNIPAGMLAWMNQKILSKNFVSMNVAKDIDDYNLQQICYSRGTKHVVATGIFDFKGKIIGFVGGEFCRTEINDDDVDGIKATLMKISGITVAEVLKEECPEEDEEHD
ncbi:MAG: hypothetical protein ACQESF_02540 [Nanobdellota archaeon]